MEVFGFNITRSGKIATNSSEDSLVTKEPIKSFITPDSDDGAISVAGGFFGNHYVDFDGGARNDTDLIKKYRDMALHAEVEMAVDDIVNESIVFDGFKEPVSIYLDDLDASESIKNKIRDEFKFLLKTLDFYDKGYEIFRRWYVDGKLYFHIILDPQNPKKGIHEVRPIDPIKIKKIRKVNKKVDPKTGVSLIDSIEEFFVYLDANDTGQPGASTDKLLTEQGIKVAPDSISYTHSGLFDSSKKRVLGYLQKAIKPLNQLRMIEDAVVIYRISRAPERRIFYVDVGNLPKNKAEAYLRDIMNRYKNKLVYDASTGQIRDEHRHMSMMEDYWMPRREGGRGTEISTLDGGQNLGEMEDVEYFQKKLYKSLNVPISRLEAENGFNMGRSSEITRDEVKFFKFIERLRKKFSELFHNLLKVQLISKGILTEEDWNNSYNDAIFFDFTKDSYFRKKKKNELIKERIDLLQTVDDYIGKYYSIEYVRKNILKQTEDEIKEIDAQIKSETASGDIESEEDDNNEF